MKLKRPLLLLASAAVVVVLLVGGLAAKVGPTDSPYRQSALFAEILQLVVENYVDPVDPSGLLQGAYEGMLGGIDANGAYLTPAELKQWKSELPKNLGDPGVDVLKSGSSFQVVAVEPASAAEKAGIEVGDQIRSIEGRSVHDQSLEQVRRMLEGEIGTSISVRVVHPTEGFNREELALRRASRSSRPYQLSIERGVAVLQLKDLRRIDPAEVAGELDEVRSRGVERLVLDLRNCAENAPRDAAQFAGLFIAAPELRLRDRSGRLLEAARSTLERPAWSGWVGVVVNAATAGGAEALAALIQLDRGAVIYGEATYGLGAEPKLYELNDGSGLLVSSSVWETVRGDRWNGAGLKPDKLVRGEGKDFAAAYVDQLRRVLDQVESLESAAAARKTT
ncbi:MAG TPA: S41 family peptidase [Candidatus Polarisedimenticolaceae bacterium]|nr:S41 family peptidase [Candidatus Polarisedimenticolaceae bacterium]